LNVSRRHLRGRCFFWRPFELQFVLLASLCINPHIAAIERRRVVELAMNDERLCGF
jgi:hypothetical protein